MPETSHPCLCSVQETNEPESVPEHVPEGVPEPVPEPVPEVCPKRARKINARFT